MGGHDHLLGGVRVVVEVPCALRPAGVTRVYLESASLERHQVEHLVHVVNPRAELLGKVEVVRRQLVLRVVTAVQTRLEPRPVSTAWMKSALLSVPVWLITAGVVVVFVGAMVWAYYAPPDRPSDEQIKAWENKWRDLPRPGSTTVGPPNGQGPAAATRVDMAGRPVGPAQWAGVENGRLNSRWQRYFGPAWQCSFPVNKAPLSFLLAILPGLHEVR